MQQNTHIETGLSGFVATFGSGHSYRQCYVVLFARTEIDAEREMTLNHGSRWSGSLYPIEQFDLQRSLRCLAILRQRAGEGAAYFENESPCNDWWSGTNAG